MNREQKIHNSLQNIDLSSNIDVSKSWRFSVAPMYNWNDIHSTWLEAGYQIVDFDNESNDQNSGWKFTFSQNIAIDVGSTARPMLRFYATVGETDNEYRPDLTSDKKRDTVSLGAMFEAWW